MPFLSQSVGGNASDHQAGRAEKTQDYIDTSGNSFREKKLSQLGLPRSEWYKYSPLPEGKAWAERITTLRT